MSDSRDEIIEALGPMRDPTPEERAALAALRRQHSRPIIELTREEALSLLDDLFGCEPQNHYATAEWQSALAKLKRIASPAPNHPAFK